VASAARVAPAAAGSDAATRVVVVGGGFAGVACARRLQQRARGALDVVLFNRDNHMVFQPLLPDVAGSSLNPRAVAPSLRQLLPGVRCRSEAVLHIDPQARRLEYASHDGSTRTLDYAQLVLACGSAANLALLPGMADHALPLKTIGDALAIRSHVVAQLEKADSCSDPVQRRRYLSVLVVGGGFSGVEVAGELNDLLRSLRRYYPWVGADELQVTVLHSQDSILPELSAPLREFASTRMRRRGIQLHTGVRVVEVSAHGVRLADGRRLEAATVISTVGTAPNVLLQGLGLPLLRGRLPTAADMRVVDDGSLWAVGDCAHIVNAWDGAAAPPTAQFAEREGRQCADNLLRLRAGVPTRPFRFRPLGSACGIGGRSGVAEIRGLRFSGFAAWTLWRATFLLKLPGLVQKLKVGVDWLQEWFFPRDHAQFRAQRSEPVQALHYGAGERILAAQAGIGALYALQAGEAVLWLRGADGDEREHFRFGPGALIGPASFADLPPGEAELRAATPVDLLVMGTQALARLSQALKPLQPLLERAVDRPTQRIWQHHRQAMRALADVPARTLAMREPLLVAEGDAPLGPPYRELIARRGGAVLVTRGGSLLGIATRTDLLAALARGATRDSPISLAANPDTVALEGDAPAALAAERMADAGIKYLPLLDAAGRPVALLCSDDVVAFALARERQAA
jgi:NADH:ubiquinone reductase (H+-translocating)